MRLLTVPLLVLSAVCCVAGTACSPAPPSARQLVVVARGMAFLVPAESQEENPVLRFRAGERVRVVFHNDAPGLLHNFQIPSWNVVSREIRAGEITEVSFTVPSTRGQEKYNCRPHAKLMQGIVEVE